MRSAIALALVATSACYGSSEPEPDAECAEAAVDCADAVVPPPLPCSPEEDCLPPLENVRVAVHGTTAIALFEPVLGALDYRIYPAPDPDSVSIDEDGRIVIENAIYRCAGDLARIRREDDPEFGPNDASLDGDIVGYARDASQARLGWVYSSP